MSNIILAFPFKVTILFLQYTYFTGVEQMKYFALLLANVQRTIINNTHVIILVGKMKEISDYQMVTDLMFWSQDYSVDKFLNQINQRYAYNAILNLSGKENFQIKRSENLENGSVRVLLERFN